MGDRGRSDGVGVEPPPQLAATLDQAHGRFGGRGQLGRRPRDGDPQILQRGDPRGPPRDGAQRREPGPQPGQRVGDRRVGVRDQLADPPPDPFRLGVQVSGRGERRLDFGDPGRPPRTRGRQLRAPGRHGAERGGERREHLLDGGVGERERVVHERPLDVGQRTREPRGGGAVRVELAGRRQRVARPVGERDQRREDGDRKSVV